MAALTHEELDVLIKKAWQAREYAYAPYSGFSVGAALLTQSGKIYTGCNVENGAFTPTNCAERTAVFKAVSEGERSFRAVAIAADAPYTVPCGVCLQVLEEFCDKDHFQVVLTDKNRAYRTLLLRDLMPVGFSYKESINSDSSESQGI